MYFRTHSPVSAADTDGWWAREMMAPLLLLGDDEELQALIRTHLILPCLFGDFHPSHLREHAGGLLLALEKPAKGGGGLRPITCGESWRRCFASLAANAVRGPSSSVIYNYKRILFADCRSSGWTNQPAAAKPAQPSGAGGSAAAHASSQDNGNGTLVLPQLIPLHDA